MSISAWRVYEYVLECDRCGVEEVYHSEDHENGIRIHSIPTARKAAQFHRVNGKDLCHICYEAYASERRQKNE